MNKGGYISLANLASRIKFIINIIVIVAESQVNTLLLLILYILCRKYFFVGRSALHYDYALS